jgi:hypothetical protein
VVTCVWVELERAVQASNAIDHDLATFWNDDTDGRYPDTLTVTAPAATALTGVGFASHTDGVPTDFTVQTWDGAHTADQVHITGTPPSTAGPRSRPGNHDPGADRRRGRAERLLEDRGADAVTRADQPWVASIRRVLLVPAISSSRCAFWAR